MSSIQDYDVIVTIPGKPSHKQSTKFTYSSKSKRMYSYTPQRVVDDTKNFRWKLTEYLGNGFTPLDCSVEIKYRFVYKYTSDIRVSDRQRKVFRKVKPDLDNMLKFVNDCLTGLVIVDDSLISRVVAEKVYGDNERTEIYIRKLN